MGAILIWHAPGMDANSEECEFIFVPNTCYANNIENTNRIHSPLYTSGNVICCLIYKHLYEEVTDYVPNSVEQFPKSADEERIMFRS